MEERVTEGFSSGVGSGTGSFGCYLFARIYG